VTRDGSHRGQVWTVKRQIDGTQIQTASSSLTQCDTCSTMRHSIGVYAPLNTYDISFGFRKSISSADFGIYTYYTCRLSTSLSFTVSKMQITKFYLYCLLRFMTNWCKHRCYASLSSNRDCTRVVWWFQPAKWHVKFQGITWPKFID